MMVDILKSLSKSSSDLYDLYNSDWKDYQAYKMEDEDLLSLFKDNFEQGLRAILFDLNDALNVYQLNYSIDMINPILEEVDQIRNYLEDSQSKVSEFETKMERLQGDLAEEKFRTNELRGREYVNQKKQKLLEFEIQRLKEQIHSKNTDFEEESDLEDNVQKKLQNSQERIKTSSTNNGIMKMLSKRARPGQSKNCEARVFRCFENVINNVKKGETPVKLGNALRKCNIKKSANTCNYKKDQDSSPSKPVQHNFEQFYSSNRRLTSYYLDESKTSRKNKEIKEDYARRYYMSSRELSPKNDFKENEEPIIPQPVYHNSLNNKQRCILEKNHLERFRQ